MGDHERELRRASDGFLARVERLNSLEDDKRGMTPGTPEMVRVTREIEKLSREVLDFASRETDLAELAAKRQPTTMRPIAVVPPREIHEILGEWREAERALADREPGTAEWESTRADVERLRD